MCFILKLIKKNLFRLLYTELVIIIQGKYHILYVTYTYTNIGIIEIDLFDWHLETVKPTYVCARESDKMQFFYG